MNLNYEAVYEALNLDYRYNSNLSCNSIHTFAPSFVDDELNFLFSCVWYNYGVGDKLDASCWYTNGVCELSCNTSYDKWYNCSTFNVQHYVL